MSRTIKIDGDTAPLKKSILDISKTLKKDLGKTKIELFTPATKKFLQKEAVAQVNQLKHKMDGINRSMLAHEATLKKVVAGSKEELKVKEKILRATKALVDAEQERSEAQSLASKMKPKGFGQGLAKGSGFGKIGKMVGGLGLEEMSAAGALGMGLGAAGIGALVYGGSRVMAGRSTYTSGIPDRMKMLGRGMNDQEPRDKEAMYKAGLNSLTLRNARMRDVDVFGAEGASQESVIKRARTERGYGLEEGTFSGIGAQLRPQVGGKGADVTVMKLQASLIASGIKDAIGPYLESATQLLTDLNDKGFTNDESLLANFNNLLKAGAGEGRTASMMTGVDSAMRGSTGEANAMFQDVFNKQGIGGGTVGGAGAAIRSGGLFGADLDKYKFMSDKDKAGFQRMGIGGKDVGSGDYTRKVAGGLLKQLDEIMDQKTIDKLEASGDPTKQKIAAEKRLSRHNLVMKEFNLKSEAEGADVEGMLTKMADKNSTPEEQAKMQAQIKNMQESTPEIEHLDEINKSLMGIHDILENKKVTVEDEIGLKTAPVFNEMNEYLRDIDEMISTMLGWLKPDNHTIRDTALSMATGGIVNKQSIKMASDAWDYVTGSGGSKDMVSKSDVYQPRDQSQPFYMDKDIPKAPNITGPGGNADDKKQTEFLQQLVSLNSVIAKNSKDKGTLKPGTSSTTGE